MKKQTVVIVSVVAVAVLLCLSFFVVGVTKSKLEADARASQKIDSSWQVSTAVADTMGALLFYNEDRTEHRYLMYLNKPGFSFGYFFRRIGTSPEVTEGIKGFSEEGGMTLFSMNKVGAVRAERTFVDSATPTETYELEPGKPFALVFANTGGDGGSIGIYNASGESIPITTIECSS